MERNGGALPQTVDPTHHFHIALLDQRRTNIFKMEVRIFLIMGRMRNFNLFYNEPCNIYKQVLVAYNNREQGIMTH